MSSPGAHYFKTTFDLEDRGKWLANIKHQHLPCTVLKYMFICHQHFSLCQFLPNKSGPRSGLYRKALLTVNLKYKEGDAQVPFIVIELEDLDPSDLMEVVDTLMEKVTRLEVHNHSSNILPPDKKELAKDLKKARLNHRYIIPNR